MCAMPAAFRPARVEPRRLDELADRFGLAISGDGAVLLTGVTLSSEAAVPGDLFVALQGVRAHGARFAAAAAANGAVAVLTDSAGAEEAAASGLAVVVAPEPREILGTVAAWVYRT